MTTWAAAKTARVFCAAKRGKAPQFGGENRDGAKGETASFRRFLPHGCGAYREKRGGVTLAGIDGRQKTKTRTAGKQRQKEEVFP